MAPLLLHPPPSAFPRVHAPGGGFALPAVRLPLTLVLRHARPHCWYASLGAQGVHECKATCSHEAIVEQFKLQARAMAATCGSRLTTTDILAVYVSNTREGHGASMRVSTRVEYFDEDLFHDFLRYRMLKQESLASDGRERGLGGGNDGIIQLFVVPLSGRTQCIKASLHGAEGAQSVSIEQRVNFFSAHDRRKPLGTRAATFDGDEHLSRVSDVAKGSALHRGVSEQLRLAVAHVRRFVPEKYSLGESAFYFRVQPDGHLYLLYAPSLQMMTKEAGTIIHPSPSSPRASIPELHYTARLPKDFFRCPICGLAFSAAQRTTVPYHALRGHLAQIEVESGISELHAIKKTIGKISRKPEYYSVKYEHKANVPTSEMLERIFQHEYHPPEGGVDERLQSMADEICFRLLRMAYSHLTASQFKWLRDCKPILLNTLSLWVCTDCSLSSSSAAMTEQLNASRRIDNLHSPHQRFLPLSYPSFPSSHCCGFLPSLTSLHHHAPDASPHPSPHDASSRPGTSLTDNDIRKSMSLPLLLAAKDRKRLCAQRPWRGSQSQEPRFEPVDALVGKAPKRHVAPQGKPAADDASLRASTRSNESGASSRGAAASSSRAAKRSDAPLPSLGAAAEARRRTAASRGVPRSAAGGAKQGLSSARALSSEGHMGRGKTAKSALRVRLLESKLDAMVGGQAELSEGIEDLKERLAQLRQEIVGEESASFSTDALTGEDGPWETNEL
ncbi:hypothetical protein AB1Y20_016236 [Prymnesium parvum]|uniref:C2H2-type domain-containing protein n=1 Tax=Prymnesium parvum TaxID=97485 RepID=A0AB34IE68_PRYPA